MVHHELPGRASDQLPRSLLPHQVAEIVRDWAAQRIDGRAAASRIQNEVVKQGRLESVLGFCSEVSECWRTARWSE